MAATAVAQAPVPQARGNANAAFPHAQVKLDCVIAAILTLTRSGKSGSCSIIGPSRAKSIALASATKNMTCGLPMLIAIGFSSSSQPMGMRSPSIAKPTVYVPAKSRRPKSTRTSAAQSRVSATHGLDIVSAAEKHDHTACGIAARFDFAAVRVENTHWQCQRSSRAKQDQLVTTDSGLAVRNGFRAREGDITTAYRRVSIMTKSLPNPCILLNSPVVI